MPRLLRARPIVSPSAALEAQVSRAASAWGLTDRQRSIVMLLGQGDANKDIAAKLGLALRTVEVHVSEILRRAKVESRLRLVASIWMSG